MTKKSSLQTGSAHVIIVIILVVALIGALGFIVWQNFFKQDATAPVASTETAQTTENSDNEVKETTGTLQGSLTYPAGRIPENITVYAVNLETEKEYSTSEHISSAEYQYGVGYSLVVPTGSYHVYGVLSDDPGRKAYYNQFVECGMAVECTDTSPIEVKVEANEETVDAMIGDWWNAS